MDLSGANLYCVWFGETTLRGATLTGARVYDPALGASRRFAALA